MTAFDAPVRMLVLLAEIVEAGVPIETANRALELARDPARLREALDLLASAGALDAALLERAETTVLRCEVAARNRDAVLASGPLEPDARDA